MSCSGYHRAIEKPEQILLSGRYLHGISAHWYGPLPSTSETQTDRRQTHLRPNRRLLRLCPCHRAGSALPPFYCFSSILETPLYNYCHRSIFQRSQRLFQHQRRIFGIFLTNVMYHHKFVCIKSASAHVRNRWSGTPEEGLGKNKSASDRWVDASRNV